METTLSGEFVEFKATVAHASELGGELTSIISGADTHFLVRDVRVDLPGRDDVRDFLARKRISESDVGPLMVNESSAPDSVVSDQSDVERGCARAGSGRVYGDGADHGRIPLYAKVADPTAGGQQIRQVVRRSDGKLLCRRTRGSKLREQAARRRTPSTLRCERGGETTSCRWTRSRAVPNRPSSSSSRTARRRRGSRSVSSSSRAIRTGRSPLCRLVLFPSGRRSKTKVLESDSLHWVPQVGQAGSFPVTFRATDGVLTAGRTAVIHVLGEGQPTQRRPRQLP